MIQLFIYLRAEFDRHEPITESARIQNNKNKHKDKNKTNKKKAKSIKLFKFKDKFLKISVNIQTALVADAYTAGGQ
jgi:hypothetical protein